MCENVGEVNKENPHRALLQDMDLYAYAKDMHYCRNYLRTKVL